VARSNPFNGLSEFLAVAKYGSFRRAAHDLGVTPGAVSQAIQAIEARLRQPLFHRTTRSVALTEAGERLLERVRPAAGVIAESLDDLLQMGARPIGTLRLLVQRSALAHVIEPLVPVFRREYPDVKLEIAIEADHMGLVGAGYDAGVRIGEYIDRDMVATRVSRPFRWLVFGAPSYLQKQGRPRVPEDLSRHDERAQLRLIAAGARVVDEKSSPARADAGCRGRLCACLKAAGPCPATPSGRELGRS
jgi:DNA-binding transcriptional LysR family regulator